MANIVIDDGVKIPPVGKRKMLYPQLYTMEVGQSFARPVEEHNQVYNAGQQCRKKTGRKFATRLIGNGTIRIWRTQ